MEGCPVKFALGLVSGKWKLRILWELNQQEVCLLYTSPSPRDS